MAGQRGSSHTAGRHTPLEQCLLTQDALGRERSALITDIDNTFYRPGHQAAVRAAWQLRAAATEAPYPIIAVTGADFKTSVWPRIVAGELPRFEAVLGNVGTELWTLQADSSYARDKTYEQWLRTSLYNRQLVLAGVDELLASQELEDVRLVFQEPEKEKAYRQKPDPAYLPYKVSLNFVASSDRAASVRRAFEQVFPKFKIVIAETTHTKATSSANQFIHKYCLDVLAANKGEAANWLIRRLRLRRGVAAGDSGNDIDLLLDTPASFVAVAVGGHKNELKTALEGHKIATKNRKPIIFIDTDKDRRAAQTLLLFDNYLRGGTLYPRSI